MAGCFSPIVLACVRMGGPDDQDDIDELRHRFEQMIAGSFLPPRPNRRRPRRPEPLTYRVRIDLADTKPTIWRRLELSSALMLDEMHRVIQTAFGWTDSHLHRFAVGTSGWDDEAELYLCPFDVDEGEDDGVPEHEVRLDEVLVDVGDRLHYVYDYGDDWAHLVQLEALLDQPADLVARAVCTGGRRAGPPEDSGGVWRHQELVDAGEVDDEGFDIDEVNADLADELLSPPATDLAPALAGLRSRLTGRHPVADALGDLLRAAELHVPAQVNQPEATRMLQRHSWLLRRVGNDGISLTSAGYLSPEHVAAAVAELGMREEWMGKQNRESHTPQVLGLRESAQQFGLLRKHRGQLLITKRGRALVDDPVQLWWHVAARFPLHADGSVEQHAGVVSLLGVAAGVDIDAEAFHGLRNDVLAAIGWRMSDGSPLTGWSGMSAARDTVRLLGDLQAFGPEALPRHRTPTPAGRALARAVLQHRP